MTAHLDAPDTTGIPAHILAPAPTIRPGQPQPEDGHNLGYEEGTLHLGGGTHRVYANHRKTCAQVRLGEAHEPHEFGYLFRDPFTSEPSRGTYSCHGLSQDRDPFPTEPTEADLATATAVWVERQPRLIEAYQMMRRLHPEDQA